MWVAALTNPELAELRAEASASAAHDGFEAPKSARDLLGRRTSF